MIHTVEKLPDNKAGKLIKHILAYVNDRNPSTDDMIVQIAFEPIKQQLKRDLVKYEKTKENFSRAGKASAESRKIKRSQLYILHCYNSNEEFLKIGITDDSITRRYSSAFGETNSMPYKYLVLGQHLYKENEISPIDLESEVGNRFKKYTPKIEFKGHTECYCIEMKDEILEFISKKSTSFNIVEIRSTDSTVNVNDSVNDNDSYLGISITIGNRKFEGRSSDWLKANKEVAISEFVMQTYPGLDISEVFKKMDSETVSYHFKDTNHPFNYFKSVCKRMAPINGQGAHLQTKKYKPLHD